MISYDNLTKTLKSKGLSYIDLRDNGISPNTVSRIKQGEPVHLNVICKICEILDCKIEDIVTYEKDSSKKNYHLPIKRSVDN